MGYEVDRQKSSHIIIFSGIAIRRFEGSRFRITVKLRRAPCER